MIKLIEKQIKLILISFLLLFTCTVYSSSIIMNVSGNNISGGTFIKYQNSISSSSFDYTPSLLPVDAWVPYIEKQTTELKFISNTGDAFLWKTEIKGFKFGFQKSKIKIDPYTKGVCEVNTVDNDGVFIFDGSSCISKLKISSNISSKIEPFKLVKPYIDISTLLSSLQGHEAGVYHANMPYKVKYFYEIDGVKSYRDFYRTLGITINYNPVELIKITKIGNGVINNLNYNKSKLTVSGKTSYRIIISGYLPYGVKLSFDNHDKSDERYLIKDINSGTVIPYYIKCDKCINKDIVNNLGYKISEEDNIVKFDNRFGKLHDFYFQIGFENIKSNTIRSSEYRGQFNVLFEPVF